MILTQNDQGKYARAKKRVDALKAFHSHATAYIVVNVIILLLRANIFSIFNVDKFDLNFERWLDWNTYLTPIFWGIGLIFHGLYVYRYKIRFIKQWEDRKLRELMEKDEDSEKKEYL